MDATNCLTCFNNTYLEINGALKYDCVNICKDGNWPNDTTNTCDPCKFLVKFVSPINVSLLFLRLINTIELNKNWTFISECLLIY